MQIWVVGIEAKLGEPNTLRSVEQKTKMNNPNWTKTGGSEGGGGGGDLEKRLKEIDEEDGGCEVWGPHLSPTYSSSNKLVKILLHPQTTQSFSLRQINKQVVGEREREVKRGIFIAIEREVMVKDIISGGCCLFVWISNKLIWLMKPKFFSIPHCLSLLQVGGKSVYDVEAQIIYLCINIIYIAICLNPHWWWLKQVHHMGFVS